MRRLRLTNGKSATVDEALYETLARYEWTDHGKAGGIRNEEGEHLCRVILGRRSRVAYRNGDRYDLRRTNLYCPRKKEKPPEEVPAWIEHMLEDKRNGKARGYPTRWKLMCALGNSGATTREEAQRAVLDAFPEGWRCYVRADGKLAFRPDSTGVWWPETQRERDLL